MKLLLKRQAHELQVALARVAMLERAQLLQTLRRVPEADSGSQHHGEAVARLTANCAVRVRWWQQPQQHVQTTSRSTAPAGCEQRKLECCPRCERRFREAGCVVHRRQRGSGMCWLCLPEVCRDAETRAGGPRAFRNVYVELARSPDLGLADSTRS